MNSVDDIGAKQCWRFRLLEYYSDPGTKTFKPNQLIKEQTTNEFVNFISFYNLSAPKLIEEIKSKAKTNYIRSKYGYVDNKTIASAFFFLATAKDRDPRLQEEALRLYLLAHQYYPEHFQVNTQLFLKLSSINPGAANYVLQIMDKEVPNNAFLAKGLMDSLFSLKHPATYDYAKRFKAMFPETQLFNVYLFNAAYNAGDYETAYQTAKMAVKKYHEESVYDDFIKQYEAVRK